MKEFLNAFCYAIFCIAGLLFWYFMMYHELHIWTNISTFIFTCLVLLVIVYIDMSKKVNKKMLFRWILFGVFILFSNLSISLFRAFKRVIESAKDDIFNQ